MVGASPSASVAVAAQVRVSPTRAVLGVTLTLVTSGGVFSTVASAVSLWVPPSGSAAVAVQVMASPGSSFSTSV